MFARPVRILALQSEDQGRVVEERIIKEVPGTYFLLQTEMRGEGEQTRDKETSSQKLDEENDSEWNGPELVVTLWMRSARLRRLEGRESSCSFRPGRPSSETCRPRTSPPI